MPNIVSITAGAAAGASPTVSLDSGANDTRGQITVTTGASGTAAGKLCTVQFGGSWQNWTGGGPYMFITLNGDNVAATALGNISAKLGAFGLTFDLYCTGTPAVSTAYTINYMVAAGIFAA